MRAAFPLRRGHRRVDVLGQEGVEVAVIQRADVVEALAPEGSDHPFGDGIRRRGSHRSEHGVNTEGFGPGAAVTAVDAVTITAPRVGP